MATFKIKGFGAGIYKTAALEIAVFCLKICFYISPLAIWKICELVKLYGP